MGRNLYNWPASDPKLRKACTFLGEGECHISSKLLRGSYFHLPFPA